MRLSFFVLFIFLVVSNSLKANGSSEDFDSIDIELFSFQLKSTGAKYESQSPAITEINFSSGGQGFSQSTISEALKLTPGINIAPSSGLGGTLALRGLSGGYVSGTYNGRELITSSNDREVDLYLVPAELLSGIEILKATDASRFSSGIGGEVSLNTANPLDINAPHSFKIDFKSRFNTLANKIEGANEIGDRLTFLYQGKYFDDSVGVLLGYSNLSQEAVAAEYYASPWGAPGSIDTVYLNTEELSLPNRIEMYQYSGEETRDAFVAALHYQPSEKLKLTLDFLVSDFESRKNASGYAIGRLSGFEISNFSVSGDDLVGGNFSLNNMARTAGPSHGGPSIHPSDGFQLVFNDLSKSKSIETMGIDVRWVDDNWELVGNISTSKADIRDQNLLATAHLYDADPANVDVNGNLILDSANRTNNLAFSYLNSGGVPQLTFGSSVNFNNTNPAAGPVAGLSSYEHIPYWSEEDLESLNLAGKFKFEESFVSSIESGVRSSTRKYVSGQEVFVYSIFDGDPSNTAAEPLPLSSNINGIARWSGSFSHFPSFPAFNATDVLLRYQSSDYLRDENNDTRDITPKARWGEGRAWSMLEGVDIEEDVLSIFLMANFQGELFGKGLSGNIGLQRVNTKVLSASIVPADPSIGREADEILDGEGLSIADVPLIGGTPYNYELQVYGAAYSSASVDYTTNLPSFNLRYEINDNNVLKFSTGKLISRVPFNRLANDASERYNRVETGNEAYFEYSVYAPNSAAIEPFEAMNYEVSFDHLSQDEDFGFGVNYFAKELKNRLQTISIDGFSSWETFGFEPLRVYSQESERDPNTGLPQASTYAVLDGDLTITQNVNQGNYIHGLELSYYQQFVFLPEPFHTLAMSASFVNLEGDIRIQNPFVGGSTNTVRMPGLVENTLQAALFWEYKNLRSQLGFRHESEKNGSMVNGSVITFEPATYIDLSFAFRFLEGLDAYFTIENLSDEQVIGYYDKKIKVASVQEFGRSYHLGLQYRF